MKDRLIIVYVLCAILSIPLNMGWMRAFDIGHHQATSQAYGMSVVISVIDHGSALAPDPANELLHVRLRGVRLAPELRQT